MRFSVLIIVLLPVWASGCAAVNTTLQSLARIPSYLNDKMTYKAALCEQRQLDRQAVHQAKLEDMQDEAESLRLSRELLLEKRRMMRETELKKQAATKEALAEEAKLDLEASTPDYKEQMRSNLGLNFNQRFRVGQLQVNYDELKKKMTEWEDQQKKLQEQYDKNYKSWKENLSAGDGGKQALAADCSRPAKEKLKENLQGPPTLKIMPTEIPLMLPVTLDVEINNPTIGETHVSRIPTVKENLQECQKENLEGCGCTDFPPAPVPAPAAAFNDPSLMLLPPIQSYE